LRNKEGQQIRFEKKIAKKSQKLGQAAYPVKETVKKHSAPPGKTDFRTNWNRKGEGQGREQKA